MNYPAASSGVSKTTTGKILRPKGRGIHPDGNKQHIFVDGWLCQYLYDVAGEVFVYFIMPWHWLFFTRFRI
jgi:hypothetical protein